jgi:hypothetical protein
MLIYVHTSSTIRAHVNALEDRCFDLVFFMSQDDSPLKLGQARWRM